VQRVVAPPAPRLLEHALRQVHPHQGLGTTGELRGEQPRPAAQVEDPSQGSRTQELGDPGRHPVAEDVLEVGVEAVGEGVEQLSHIGAVGLGALGPGEGVEHVLGEGVVGA
jgi:hypothetical protein